MWFEYKCWIIQAFDGTEDDIVWKNSNDWFQKSDSEEFEPECDQFIHQFITFTF